MDSVASLCLTFSKVTFRVLRGPRLIKKWKKKMATLGEILDLFKVEFRYCSNEIFIEVSE